MFAKAERGEVSKADAIGRARASKGKDLPEHVKKATFAAYLLKLADDPEVDDESPEDDWLTEKPPGAAPKTAEDKPGTRGLDGPSDAAAEAKAKSSLKGAPQLPKDFKWPSAAPTPPPASAPAPTPPPKTATLATMLVEAARP